MRHLLSAVCFSVLALTVACSSSSNGPSTSSPSSGATSSPRVPVPLPLLKIKPAASGNANAPVYIALGDSLSAGIGASIWTEKGFVPLIHEALGPDFALLNLGIAGDTSHDLLEAGGPLERAIFEIQRRKDDAVDGNEVAVITLEIGGNDLLDIYFDLVVPGICPTIEEGLNKPECVEAVRNALDGYGPNLRRILRELSAADPDLPIFLMTLYNPFSGRTIVAEHDRIGELALEGLPGTPFPEGLHDIIRVEAAASGVHLVEIYPLFNGKGPEYIDDDGIHPNDTGYRVMADAVLTAMRDAGLID